jgi:hypothetical protein
MTLKLDALKWSPIFNSINKYADSHTDMKIKIFIHFNYKLDVFKYVNIVVDNLLEFVKKEGEKIFGSNRKSIFCQKKKKLK